MLVITRKTDESLLISDNIEITVLEISKDRVKIGVSAPKEVTVIRYELIAAQNENVEAAQVISKNALEALMQEAKNQTQNNK